MRKGEPTTRGEHREAVHRALGHILRDLDAPARLAEIASVTGFSPHHLNRIFSGLVGE